MARNRYDSVNIMNFSSRFPDEQACREHLFKLRWPDGFVCPRCSNPTFYNLPKRMLYQCKNCGYQVSVTAGTVMHRTRTPLVKWFWSILLASADKRGISALALSKKVDISYWVAWTMLGKIRKAMGERDANYKLAGLIEVDESFFGGSPSGNGTRGRGTDKLPVLVEVSTSKNGGIGFAKFRVMQEVSRAKVKSIVAETVLPGQTIKTDGFSLYNGINDIGYIHEATVVYGQSGCGIKNLHKWLNIVVSNAKAFIMGTYHGLDGKYLQSYLDEFCYRFNRRRWENQLFERLLNACINYKPAIYSELT